jgi:hypothetical protein
MPTRSTSTSSSRPRGSLEVPGERPAPSPIQDRAATVSRRRFVLGPRVEIYLSPILNLCSAIEARASSSN